MREEEKETRANSEPGRSDSGMARRYPVALALYAVLAALVWFTVGEGTVVVLGRPVELRWIPIAILGTFAFRTVLARQAEKIRRGEK